MIDSEWQMIADEIVGLWGSGNQQLIDRRIGVLRKRFLTERLSVMQAAVKHLEVHAAHWPPMKDFHAAIDEVKARHGHRGHSPARASGSAPLGPGDCMEIAGYLVAAANDRVRSGRGRGGDRWDRYLFDLAEHYERGAGEIRAGRAFPWPPPGIPPQTALTRVLRDTRREDEADRKRRCDWYDDSREDTHDAPAPPGRP